LLAVSIQLGREMGKSENKQNFNSICQTKELEALPIKKKNAFTESSPKWYNKDTLF